MNKALFLHGKERLARVLAIGGVLGVGGGLFGFAQNSPSPPLVQPESPGVAVIGLRYFRLEPAVSDTTFRLLVIPVQFPEDGVLGGGSETEILDKLNGSDPTNLSGYYAHETAGRLHILATLAPHVTAPHSRAYYTTEGGAFGSNGLDPGTYPHNGQGLVDDVTRALTDRVDFRLYDNTKDGIVDGLLILHSGPKSAETSVGRLPADVLIAHAFTLPRPESRGGSMVFPYALAATRDGIGVWAHEIGHLFGLPDLYVANSVCFGPGMGEWSLMATGANRGGGENPTGLDAFSLQLLGMTPRFDQGSGVALSQGVFLRASDPGEENGPRYYLVDVRESGDGPAGSTPARVVYVVNEEAVDNRSCSNPPETYRPLVRVLGVVCPGDTACAQTFYQSCDLCPNVGFTFSGTTVHVQSGALPAVVLKGVSLDVPQLVSGKEQQRVVIAMRNVDTDASHKVLIEMFPLNPDSVCIAGASSWPGNLPPGATNAVETNLTPCTGTGLPRQDLSVIVRITDTIFNWSHEDTLVLPVNNVGLKSQFCDYTGMSLDPQQENPWQGERPGHCPPPPSCCTSVMTATLLPLSHAELVSPWFTVPSEGQLLFGNDWNLTALSADVALDAAQVRLRRPLGDDVVLEPPLGWGYTAERGVGDALGGQSVLSGSGFRASVFDLSSFRGQVVQLVFVVAGDAEASQSRWTVWLPTVTQAPQVSFSLEADPTHSGSLVAHSTSAFQPGVNLVLYRGLPAIVPTDTAFVGTWNGDARLALGHFEGAESRFELVWTDSTGAASVGAVFNLPVTPAEHFLLAPSPNPVHNGEGQNWVLRVPDNAPPGNYTLRLVSLDGGVLLETSVRIDQPGTRLIPWNGQDGEGRTITSGIYFLEARRPDGVRNGQRIVVLP